MKKSKKVARRVPRKPAKKKVARKKTVKKKVVRRKPAKKKVVRKKPAKKKVARKKPVKKKVVRRKSAGTKISKRKRLKKAVISFTQRDRNAAHTLKQTIKEYMKAITIPRDYNDLKHLANTGLDKLLMLGKEFDRAQRQYLNMAQRYVNKITGY